MGGNWESAGGRSPKLGAALAEKSKKKSSRRKTLQVEYPRRKASLFLFYLVSAVLPRCVLGCLMAYPRATPAAAQGVLRRGLFEEKRALFPLKKYIFLQVLLLVSGSGVTFSVPNST